jgi:hypothetical protein
VSSPRRSLASRANGARSRGPVTPQGKQRSSQNALRHGLLARCVVMQEESRESFEAHLAQHLERLQPADAVELGMIEEMAPASWRMRRAWALETPMLDNAAAAPGNAGDLVAGQSDCAAPDDTIGRVAAAFTGLATHPALGLMHRYEIRLHLIYQRSLHNLLLLRAVLPNEPSPNSGQLLDVNPATSPADAPPDESEPNS